MLLAPGDYELLIDGTGDAAGPYAFRLLDVRAAATLVDGHGETVTGALAPASETRVHAIDLAEGESFTFDARQAPANAAFRLLDPFGRSEEHTSELQSLMRISYAVFCLTKKK